MTPKAEEARPAGRLQQKRRACEDWEHLFRLGLLLVLLTTALLSAIASYQLHQLADYKHLFQKTKTFLYLIKTKPTTHRTLVLNAIKENDPKFLKEVLDASGDSKAATADRPDRHGDSPLHIACKTQQSSCL